MKAARLLFRPQTINPLLRLAREHAGPIHNALRKRKADLFFASLNPAPTDTLLDVGGWAGMGNGLGRIYDYFHSATSLNLIPGEPYGNAKFVQGDAREMPFADGSFDFVFSNAVIEHVGPFEQQMCMAREIQRVARKGYFVITPNRWFPVDPHSYLPCFHLAPMAVRRWLNPEDDYWMISPPTMRKLFPGARIETVAYGTGIVATRRIVNR